MYNKARTIEFSVIAVIIIAILLKLFHIPFASPLLILSLGTLAMMYAGGGGYFFADPESEEQHTGLSKIAGCILAIIPIGLLFKIMYWPMAQSQLTVGLILSLILFVFIYMKSKNAIEDVQVFYKGMLLRTGILVAFAFIFYLTPMSTLITIQHWDDPELTRLKIESYTHPEDKEARRQLDEYWHKK